MMFILPFVVNYFIPVSLLQVSENHLNNENHKKCCLHYFVKQGKQKFIHSLPLYMNKCCKKCPIICLLTLFPPLMKFPS